MESLDTAAGFMDELLDFSSDLGEEDDDEEKPRKALPSLNPNGLGPASFDVLDPDDPARSLPEFAEEELEWLSNKDAFPAVETFVDILSCHPGSAPKQQSPVSVLENSTNSTGTVTSNGSNRSSGGSSRIIMSCCPNLHVPVKARSKRRRRGRRDLRPGQNWCWWAHQESAKDTKMPMTIGRKCQHCGAEKTPQWRAGPLGPKTLCNACGVRYKSGRLVPEYRPASSPTFSAEVHSNSHRKIIEMRRQKQSGLLPVKPMDTGYRGYGE